MKRKYINLCLLITLNYVCGTSICTGQNPPPGCATDGTIIFREDFGGNLPSDPSEKSTGIPQVGYTYRCPGIGGGIYCICKQGCNNGINWWYNVDDHTYPNDITRGYLLQVDADVNPGIFYSHQIDNLCTASKLYFSLWVVNVDAIPGSDLVNLKIRLETTGGGLLKEITTGNLPYGDPTWKHFGTDFTIPSGLSSLVFKIINNSTGGDGNDLAIDDIEVRLCAPPVTLTQPTKLDTVVCIGNTFTFQGSYTDDETFGNSLVYRWERNPAGDINSPGAWTQVTSTQETSNTGTVNSIYTVNSVSLSDTGYYRLAVANAANTGNYNCRAMSDIIHLQVANIIPGTVSADQTVCYNSVPETLTSAAATGGSGLMYQWQQNIDGGTEWIDVTAGTGGTTLNYTPPALTQTTKYRLKIYKSNIACTAYSDIITVTVTSCAVADRVTVFCDEMPYSIIDVLANDILSPDCTAPVVTVTVQPKNGTATVNGDNKIEYAGNTPGLDSLTYRVTCGTQYSEAKVYITVDASAFVDDVWYWGQNSAGAGYGSPGIRFVKDSQGNYVPRDASGEASVYSHTSSLVVRSPYCDEVIFYASSNQLYNGFHNPIQNGSFDGASDICDGMASCYMGDNKYLFFFLTRNRELRAYVIDMNVNNGRGARIKEIIIEQASSNMAPSIELIVRAGTTDQYWLLYGHCQSGCSGNDNNEMRTRLVNVSDPDNPQIGNILFRTPKSLARTHKLKVSQQNNRVAITNIHIYTVDLYDFDNSTGQLSNRQTITGLLSHPVGIEFSPDGTQLYAATGNGNVARLFQYNISVTPPAHVGDVQYWTQNAIDHRGGGLKLGLDGKIYVVQSNTNKVGAISDPNSTASLATRYNSSALTLSVTGVLDLNFSTAITNPAIISCNTNSPPVTQADDTALCLSATSKTVKVNVLLNDNDADNDTIYLTNAEFLNKADADLATLTVNPADSTVTLTLKTDASVTVGYIFDIIYNVKDNGLPLSRCAAGSLKVKVSQMSYPDIRVRVCPDAGDISLAKYIDTVDNITDIQWAHQISGIPVSSPEGIISTGNLTFSRVHTLTYTVTSRCVSEQKRKVYLEVLKDGSMRPLKDTVAICYINAEAVQINQLFGIEAGGTWSYPSTAYITESTSPTYSGAVVMNGKGIYENDVSSIPFITYHGVKAKAVKFTYTTDIDGCLKGREYSIVVVLTEDMMK